MEKKQINLGLFTSVYSYFLFLLIKGYNENDIIIVHDSFPDEISKNINPITVSVVKFKYGGIKQSISKLGIIQIIKGIIIYIYNYFKLRLIIFIKTFNKRVENYGHPFSTYSFMFYENKNSNIIEDGLANYTRNICQPHKINKIIDIILHIFGIYFLNECETYGSHKNIKNIYLTNENNNPLIKDKVKIINITQLWNNLNFEEQNKILDIFNINFTNFNFKNKIALILTEPFSQEEYMTLDEELRIYKNIIEKFKDMTILLKPHPRDLKNYNEIFPDIEIINNYFPIELITLININPTVVCSPISTALLNFKNSEIYVYEGDLHDSRLDKYREDLINLIKNRD